MAFGDATTSAPRTPRAAGQVRVVECPGANLRPREWLREPEVAEQLAKDLVNGERLGRNAVLIRKFVRGTLREISVVANEPSAIAERVAKVRTMVYGESFVDPTDWKRSSPHEIIIKDRATAEAELVPVCPG